jgi:hypothetical protein
MGTRFSADNSEVSPSPGGTLEAPEQISVAFPDGCNLEYLSLRRIYAPTMQIASFHKFHTNTLFSKTKQKHDGFSLNVNASFSTSYRPARIS